MNTETWPLKEMGIENPLFSTFDINKRIILYCKIKGYRQSEKRLHIVEQLFEINNFIDAESLWLKMGKEKQVSRATIYLNLHWLTMHDFVEKKVSGKRMFFYRIKEAVLDLI